MIDGHEVEVSGTGAWKNLTVVSTKGEVVLEKKFYKADFGALMSDNLHGPWIDKLLERAMIRKNQTEDPDINPESYSEVSAIASELMDADSDAFEHLG